MIYGIGNLTSTVCDIKVHMHPNHMQTKHFAPQWDAEINFKYAPIVTGGLLLSLVYVRHTSLSYSYRLGFL